MTVHAASVHFPIAFITISSALDIATYVFRTNPTLLSVLNPIITILDPKSTLISTSFPATAILNILSLLSYFSLCFGVVAAVPAVVSGLLEASKVIKYRGLDLNNAVVKTTLVHAGLNDVMIALAAWNVMLRRQNESFMSTGTGVGVSAVVLAGIFYAASLGGKLTYEHGVSVKRMSEKKGVSKKEL